MISISICFRTIASYITNINYNEQFDRTGEDTTGSKSSKTEETITPAQREIASQTDQYLVIPSSKTYALEDKMTKHQSVRPAISASVLFGQSSFHTC